MQSASEVWSVAAIQPEGTYSTGSFTQWRYMIHASGARNECELVRQMSLLWLVQSSTALVKWQPPPAWKTEWGESAENLLVRPTTFLSE